MRRRQPPPPGRGRPKLNIDPENVRLLASQGLEIEDIAPILGCSPSTLRGRFRADYDQGYYELTVRLRMAMFRLALAGDRQALLWELRVRRLYENTPPRRNRLSRRLARSYGGLKKRSRPPRQNRGARPAKPRLRAQIIPCKALKRHQ